MNTKILKNKLPEKLSACIRLAVKDLTLVEKDPRYVVDMHSWHNGIEGACAVCLGGAVMAKKLKVELTEFKNPVCLEEELRITHHDRIRLIALDNVRSGYIRTAVIGTYGSENLPDDFYYTLPNYFGNKEEFKKQLLEVAKKLEAIGL